MSLEPTLNTLVIAVNAVNLVLVAIAVVALASLRTIQHARSFVQRPVYLHRKTGNRYVILHIGKYESGLTECVIYQREDKAGGNTVWVRPYNEFFDGRFTHVSGPNQL